MIKKIKIINTEDNDCFEINNNDIIRLTKRIDRYDGSFAMDEDKNNIVEMRNSDELRNRALYVSSDFEPHIVSDSVGATCILFTRRGW